MIVPFGTLFARGRMNPKYLVMKKFFTLCFLGLMMSLSFAYAQAPEGDHGRSIPAVDVEDLEGSAFSTADLENEGKPMIISFWATWCKPCVLELKTIQEEYENLQDETGVKLVAISIDDARNKFKVRPFVDGRGWEYDVYIDANGDFKRAMGVVNVPHTFLVDGECNIVWEHNSYSPGDEEELYEKVRELAESGD